MGRRPQARAKILDTAALLFWNHGYSAVSVDEVCALAQVNKGSLYHYHRDKESLAVAVIEHNLQRTAAQLLGGVESLRGQARILGYLDAMIEWQAQNLESQGSVPGCPFGKMAAGQGGTAPIGLAVCRALDAITDFVAAALHDMLPRTNKRKRQALAEEFMMLWQGALVVAEARNSLEPLKSVRTATAGRLRSLRAP